MKLLQTLACGLVCAVLAVAAAAQTSVPPATYPNSNPNASPNSGYPRSASGRQGNRQPCWQQVGISQAVHQQRQQLEQQSRSQVEAVCQNNSLSAQQKEQQIRQIRQQNQRQVEALIGSQKDQELRSCRERSGEGAGGHERGQNVCAANAHP